MESTILPSRGGIIEHIEEERKSLDDTEVQINTMADLAKMKFTDIKKLDLSKCKGDVYEAALKQAIELEKKASVSF